MSVLSEMSYVVLRPTVREPRVHIFVFASKFQLLNVTIFTRDNVSEDVSLSSLDLPLAWGYVLEEEFARYGFT